MIHILYGEDDFTIREQLSRIKQDCGGALLGEANAVVFDGSKLRPDELLAACNTISFLAPKRLVIVDGLLGRFEKGGRKPKKSGSEIEQWGQLAEQAALMPESTVLVLIDGKLNKTNPLLKQLSKVAQIRQCVAPKGPDLQNWIRDRVAGNGGKIAPPAMRLLADLIGSNLWVLSSEIHKLCLYAGTETIDTQTVNLLVSDARESNVFQMVDAIVGRRQAVAARLMRQLINEGSAPPYLLFMITRQFRLLIQAKMLLDQRMVGSSIGQKIGINSEFVLDKTLTQTRGYSMQRLRTTYRKLLDTDIAIKTGRLGGEVALDMLVTDLCAG